MITREESEKEAQNLVGKRLGSRRVTGYIYTKTSPTGNSYLCLTMICDCGRKCVVPKWSIKRRTGLKGCPSCSLITKGMTELEAQNKLRQLESVEIDR